MQIGLECFLDEQLSSMIASENRHGDCEIQHKTDCIIYDTEEDHYLEEYLEEIMDAFTVAKHLKVAESDVRADYLKNFLSKWKVFSVTGDDIQQIITAIVVNGIKMNQSYLTRRLQYENSFRRIQWNNNVS